MPTVLITTSSFDLEAAPALRALADTGWKIITNPFGRRLSENEAATLFAEHDPVGVIAGVEPITAAVLTSAPSLKAIARLGTGIDNVDRDAVEARGIALSRTPEAPAAAVAELTLALMLASLRHVAEADRGIRGGAWQAHRGRLLSGKRVALVGLGHVGRRVAELVRAFGAAPVAVDPLADDTASIPIVALHEALASADIVSLHLPLSADTRHLIDADALARMRPESILINTARGGLVDEAALNVALAEGRLAAAALDVFEAEPYQGPLATRETATLTAHMGSAAVETRSIMERDAAENLVADLTAARMV
jgi:D-3-phosphoglycerate dehydrogenase